jgi:hypothetical protein
VDCHAVEGPPEDDLVSDDDNAHGMEDFPTIEM